MAKTKAQKKVLLDDYREKIKSAKAIFVVKPTGLQANESVALKKSLAATNSSYNVIKNSLFRIASKEENLSELDILKSGNHAIVTTGDLVSESAKAISKFAKDTNKLELEGGYLDGQVITKEQATMLAELPSKEVLLGQLLSVFNGPMRGLVTVLNGNMRSMVYALNAIKDSKNS